jgi:hypothetical protein
VGPLLRDLHRAAYLADAGVLTQSPPGVGLRLATTLLRTTDAPVKQIAAACGMDDLAYSSRQFRKRYSLPPAAYRNQSQLRTVPEATDR